MLDSDYVPDQLKFFWKQIWNQELKIFLWLFTIVLTNPDYGTAKQSCRPLPVDFDYVLDQLEFFWRQIWNQDVKTELLTPKPAF